MPKPFYRPQPENTGGARFVAIIYSGFEIEAGATKNSRPGFDCSQVI